MYGLEHKLDSKCVYVHFIKSIGIPIYIGEGSVERAFNFTNRNNKWKELVSNLNDVHVEIVAIDITKEECIEIEKQLIKLYKERGFELVNCNNGGSCIGTFGEDNYFYNKHLFGKDNGNYGNKYSKNPLSIEITGYKKSHKGFAFVDFFRLTKEQQNKYREQVIAKLYS